jgi:hypothetical protein
MKFRLLLVFLALAFTVATVAPAAPSIPKPLLAQVQRLVELLSDGYAVGYSNGTLVQTIKRSVDNEIALVVFTVEGFGGGNNYSQYLAVFSPEKTENGKQHFMLIDVMRIGGGGWRTVKNLNAKTTNSPKNEEITIAIDALENTDNGSLNFPSKKITISLALKNGRLNEQKTLVLEK